MKLSATIVLAVVGLSVAGCETLMHWFVDRNRGCDLGGGCPPKGSTSGRVLGSPSVSAASAPMRVTDVADPTERAEFESLTTAAFAVLQSDAFRANLRAVAAVYPVVYVHFLGSGAAGDRSAVVQSPTELVSVTSGAAPYRYVSSPAYLVDGAVAQAGWTERTDQSGSMTIGRSHLARWRSSDPVERSCAINTVAHEFSHLVSNDRTLFMAHITDTYAARLMKTSGDGSPINPPNAVASYLIGAVAQCTWLQQQGYSPSVDLQTCVRVFGHRSHNGNRCTAFSGGQAVFERDGLPAAYILVDRQD